MPELPEVETVTRSIAPRIVGRRILGAEFSCVRVLLGDADDMAATLVGKKIVGVRRHGKFILIQLQGGGHLVVHLGMTGRLLFNAERGPHTHAVLTLDRGVVIYDDPRQFGKIEVSEGLPARVAKLGPEPLEVGLAEFTAALRKR